jgi:DNA-binding MarR family transcriptional regulator
MKSKVAFKHISAYDVPEKSPGFLLWHVSTAWRSAIEHVLKPLALTHPQFVVLASLGWLTRNGERVTQAMLGVMVGLDPNTISQIVRGLENKKLIKREASADRRVKNPFLTATGSHLVAQALPAVEAADKAFFSTLTAQELTVMTHLFQRLSKAIS